MPDTYIRLSICFASNKFPSRQFFFGSKVPISRFLKSVVRDVPQEDRDFSFQFQDRLLSRHDSTSLKHVDGLTDGSVIYAFKPTVASDEMLKNMQALNLGEDSVETSHKLPVEAKEIHLHFDGCKKFDVQITPFIPISKFINRSRFDLSGFTFQFRDKVLYSPSAGFGEGFTGTTEVRDVPGLVPGCCIYLFSSTP